MATVDLDTEFTTYADVDDADTYLDAAIHADAWRALTDDDVKGRALVTATRILDRQLWLPEWDTFAKRENEAPIIAASIELALALVEGSDVQTRASNAELVRSIQAGSVSIVNFRGVEISTRFGQIITELLRGYLGASGGAFTPKSTGVADETIFPIDLGYLPGGM